MVPQISSDDASCPFFSKDGDSVAEVIEWIRGRGKVLIVTHDNPDPDSIAAAIALRHLLLVKTGQNAVITYGGIVGRGENRSMVKLLEIQMKPICQLDLDQFAVVCMVDTQPNTGNNSFPADRQVHLVIDHHAPKTDLSNVCWVDIRTHYGASATILYEYLCQQDVKLNTKLATSLFYAIKSETQDLGREWSKADRDAYLKLLPLSNNRILFDIVHPQVPREYFSAFRTAIDFARVYGEVLVFNLRRIDNPDLVAELADFLLRQEGVKYVLGMGWYDGMQILSMRSSAPEALLGLVIQQMVEGLGTAGGHGMVAGGQIREMDEDEAAQEELERLLTRRLFKALQLDSVPGEPLLAEGP
ncbi:DHHA1 domain-containing protein [Malonomonas rubra DSM 5091]|uniref:DHHA1 domain-containing protein n=1 Tax=Malonomonas rubra DSM 5091 TaxID=1122189 RepID=A0A1M6DKI5_MALRU|nr:DHH family phosphoesterase [Malonomonas rubra]SHI73824.1 DHHA1 domain-containing protein [Malonomonas rubra DSM 5091]